MFVLRALFSKNFWLKCNKSIPILGSSFINRYNLIGREEYALNLLNKIKHRPEMNKSPVEDAQQTYCRITQRRVLVCPCKVGKLCP